MSREDYSRSALALIMSELVPPILREAAVQDEQFAAGLGLAVDGVVSFAPSGAAFTRSALIEAVRIASRADGVAADVADEAGLIWHVKLDRDDRLPIVAIRTGDVIIHVPHLGAVSERTEDRIAVLDEAAARVRLPKSAKDRWAGILNQRGLRDDEVGEFSDDINNTPISVSDAIAKAMRGESTSFDVLVPRSSDYYTRLIGLWSGQENIRDYAEQVLPSFFAELLGRDPAVGLRLALLLCSHPIAVDKLAVAETSGQAFDHVAQWAVNGADAMTQCSVLELGLLLRNVSDESKVALTQIAEGLSLPDGAKDNLFEMLSNLFVFVYGQLSHTKVLAGKPTFWRRMAAFAQAAILLRCMATNRDAYLEFTENLRAARARPFLLQVYVDLRAGPLWQSHFALVPQIRNEFVGRLISRAQALEETAKAIGVRNFILGDDVTSLKSSVHLYLTYMAGPLEDNIPLAPQLDPNSKAMIIAQLSESKPTMLSFAGVINSAFLLHLPPEIPELAAQALERAQYRIEADSKEMRGVVLTGLASCAAVTRSTQLADAVFTVIRYYRRFFPNELDLNDAVRVGSVACASRADLAQWCETMGNLLADFAFQSLSRDEAGGLEVHILELCGLVPELWASCGPALAAAQATAA